MQIVLPAQAVYEAYENNVAVHSSLLKLLYAMAFYNKGKGVTSDGAAYIRKIVGKRTVDDISKS